MKNENVDVKISNTKQDSDHEDDQGHKIWSGSICRLMCPNPKQKTRVICARPSRESGQLGGSLDSNRPIYR